MYNSSISVSRPTLNRCSTNESLSKEVMKYQFSVKYFHLSMYLGGKIYLTINLSIRSLIKWIESNINLFSITKYVTHYRWISSYVHCYILYFLFESCWCRADSLLINFPLKIDVLIDFCLISGQVYWYVILVICYHVIR